MAETVRQYYTLDRDPDSDEWDTCPGCGEALRSKGRDPHVDEFDVYEYFVCDKPQEECRVREVLCRAGGPPDEPTRSGGRF